MVGQSIKQSFNDNTIKMKEILSAVVENLNQNNQNNDRMGKEAELNAQKMLKLEEQVSNIEKMLA